MGANSDLWLYRICYLSANWLALPFLVGLNMGFRQGLLCHGIARLALRVGKSSCVFAIQWKTTSRVPLLCRGWEPDMRIMWRLWR
jgi:hypothetical protein